MVRYLTVKTSIQKHKPKIPKALAGKGLRVLGVKKMINLVAYFCR
jgi:hypothetical protein